MRLPLPDFKTLVNYISLEPEVKSLLMCIEKKRIKGNTITVTGFPAQMFLVSLSDYRYRISSSNVPKLYLITVTEILRHIIRASSSSTYVH